MFTTETRRHGEYFKGKTRAHGGGGGHGGVGCRIGAAAQDATKRTFTTETRRHGEYFKGKTRAHSWQESVLRGEIHFDGVDQGHQPAD
jgi:hypothetical protein